MAERETKTLYHGTSLRFATQIVETPTGLITYIHPGKPNYSGSLTNNLLAAKIPAWGLTDFPDKPGLGYRKPVVMVYEIPVEELVDMGSIGGNNDANISGFVTTHDISVADLPDQFLEAVHSTREELQAQVDKGEIVFKRVPNEYFQHLEVLGRTS